jgi:hypothetical protein
MAMPIRILILALLLTLPRQLLADDYSIQHAAPGSAAKTDSLQARTVAAIDAGTLPDLQKQLEQEAASALADVQHIDWPAAAELGAYREFARYFASLRDTNDAERRTLKWLAAQPRLMPVLMSAVSAKDSPRKLLALLSAMQADEGASLNDYADLATAFLVVWDKELDSLEHKGPVPDPAHVLELLHYFQNSRAVRFDPRRLPWQLAIYAVDIKVNEAEMNWTLGRYANRGDIGAVYFDVPYDMGVFEHGSTKQIDSHDFTLPNLLRYGGVCIEQAYFAAQVAKTLGVPSCICIGQGGDNGSIAHAWVGFLTVRGRNVQWDFSQGRYEEEALWSADIIDPQTHQMLDDADVGMTAKLLDTPTDARLQSALVFKLADAIDARQRPMLYEKTIDLSPGNRPAWIALATLGKNGDLTSADAQAVDRAVERLLVGPYPDFGWQMLVGMAAGQEDQQQIETLGRIAPLFRGRPDLVAIIRVRQGDLLRKDNRDDAMTAYGDVLTNYLKAGPVILRAMSSVDEILRAKNDLPRLARAYQQVWQHVPRPDPSAFAYESPYYILGQAFAGLLDETGNANGAAEVRRQLGMVQVAAVPR